ncbi:MAG: P-loop NTPase [Candidatus Latescibacteria bacterium]|nr:P-loop NTPase [Candidatus Latescibacterota bacterium]
MSAQVDLEREPDSDTDLILLDGQVPATTIWPVAGGKGGTGKSTLTANLGVGLALLGYKVILVDGDLGGADLHLFFNQISPPRSLGSFLTSETRSLRDVLLPTPTENLKLICGGNELVGAANLSYLAKERLIRHIQTLDADYVLVDLGAGSAYNTLDFFSLSNQGIVVCTPEPQARVDAYGFIKNTVYRKLRRRFARHEGIKEVINQFAKQSGRRTGRLCALVEMIGEADPQAGRDAEDLLHSFRPRLLLNRVRRRRHVDEVHRFLDLVQEYLSVKMDYIGYVRSDEAILEACERRRPVLLESPKASASRDIYTILMKGLRVSDRLHRFTAEDAGKLAQVAKTEARFW